MKQKTAIEWLVEQLSLNFDITEYHESKDILSSINKLNNLIDYAKQMEKEQIQKAFSDGQETPINHPTIPHYSREEYYNNTYSKRQDSPDTDDIK